jgi:predicted RNA-binding protein YlxR (DUF448 family)
MSISKHVPQRSCIACRKTAPKKELVRIVAGPEGVMVDETGKKKGRGAYICPELDCLQAALKKEKLDRSLRRHVTAEEKAGICEFLEKMKRSV